MKKISKNHGFTLVELMVVVAIMAIISLIAVPSYQSFQARARQKEGLALMNTYFAAAQTTRAEFGEFPGEFIETGFAPTGELGYRLEARDNTLETQVDLGPGITDPNCVRTDRVCNCGGACPNYKTWGEKPLGVLSASTGPFTVINGCAPLANMNTTNDTFSIRVGAIISTRVGVGADRWGMDHTKQLVQCQDGAL